MNGTMPEMDGYFLRLGKRGGRWNWIPAYLQLGNHTWWTSGYRRWSDIEKSGKDAEGDIYRFSTRRLGLKRAEGRASLDPESMDSESPEAKKFIAAIKKLKRMKFSDNFDELTIIATDPETTLLFKRFVGERPYLETTDLAP